ncbi:MAG: arginine--tRNA ligase [Candidatus Omnitrophica bacterium]|nr:arginine--tRNA ligase [Candidatus Omnitrophota bacterium]MCF7877162.1 arginine--tRNA ligase [Candidatus Omnitrophota bacterium]MCF7878409.1 arginine--tRNA ligase [Candidatus Omnitrophota bacterium]MCF7892866.1 arginine--tRNA ligase [Candidatus Omnitrophota bacterium]
MKFFYDKVSALLQEIASNNYNITLDYPVWELPSRQKFGDLSTAAPLKIASKLGKNPLEIAKEIKEDLSKKVNEDVKRIEIVKPGFVNLFFSESLLINELREIIQYKQNYFKGNNKRKVLIEFVSANPTGPLSIAHGRQAVVGDVIANLLEAQGNKVKREYYLNDQGRQIDLLVLSVKERIKEIEGKGCQIPEGGYQGEYLKDVAKAYLKKGKGGSLYEFCLNYIQSLIKADLDKLNISFDDWFSQKKLIEENKVEEVIKILKEDGFVYEKEGALWFNSAKFFDDKDRVIKKSDGTLTYFASDIAYHYNKCRRGYDKLINLWGPDHHGYIGRVKSALKALGYKEELLTVVIIQLVSLKSKQRMSKRAGKLIRFSELIKEVGKDAARFYYLTRKNSSHLDFDIDLAQKSSFDNPLYYIHYVCARIESIFKKANSLPDEKFSKYLKEPQELNMVRFLLQFSLCLQKSYYSLEPVFIIEYLKELASMFHKFYEKVRVLGDDSKKTKARLNILQATKEVLYFGLGILGIEPVEEM